jgi:hypothetical protein
MLAKTERINQQGDDILVVVRNYNTVQQGNSGRKAESEPVYPGIDLTKLITVVLGRKSSVLVIYSKLKYVYTIICL